MDQKLLEVVEMLKKKLGLEVIERDWGGVGYGTKNFFKIPSTLVIPEGCEMVGNYALYECDNLKKVIIPEGVKVIRDFAFCDCWGLKKVVIPEGIKKIMEYAFYDCVDLGGAIIPVSVEYIGDCAFEDCKNATIILKKHNKKLFGYDAFLGVKYVKEETGA